MLHTEIIYIILNPVFFNTKKKKKDCEVEKQFPKIRFVKFTYPFLLKLQICKNIIAQY